MSNYVPPKISEVMEKPRVLNDLRRAVGLPGMPYPMGKIAKNAQGQMQYEVGIVESASNPLWFYSPHLTLEQVNRELFCNMPTPSMMTILRDLIDATKPESKNHLIAIFGDPSSGKTFMFKQVGQLVHPEGAIMVDCGGMNVRELFWRTIIDYGTGVQEQLSDRAASGRLRLESIELLKQEFPNAVIEKGGKVHIHWDAIGERKQDDDGKATEGRDSAIERAVQILEKIYKLEGLNTQSNAFGIKTVPGEIFASIQSGRPLVLDEFTKCKMGSDDSMQTFLEFVRGDRSEWTTINPMATSSAEDQKFMRLTRDDLRVGWFLGVSGNESKDGQTTHDLSESMLSRLNPYYINRMTELDWKHRISQMLTGFPLTTICALHANAAKTDPVAFGKYMNDICKLGQSSIEIKSRPAHQPYLLQNFVGTMTAIDEKIAPAYFRRQELSYPESRLYADTRSKSSSNLQKIADEVVSGGAEKLRVTTRRFMDDLDSAMRDTAHVQAASTATLQLDLSKVFANSNLSSISRTTPGWYNLGANLSRVMLEGVVNDTRDMPNTNAFLVSYYETLGILSSDLKEADPSDKRKMLSELLRFDQTKAQGLGDSRELVIIRDAVLSAIRAIQPNLNIQQDKISLENIGLAVKEAERQAEKELRPVILPNEDLNELEGKPVVIGLSVDGVFEDIGKKSLKGRAVDLVDFRTALAALVFPVDNNQNMDSLILPSEDYFDVSELEEKLKKSSELSEDEIEVTRLGLEAAKLLDCKSDYKIDISALQVGVNDQEDGRGFIYLFRDRITSKVLAVGPSEIPADLQTRLSASNITYVNKNAEGTGQDDKGNVRLNSVISINKFFEQAAKARSFGDQSKPLNKAASAEFNGASFTKTMHHMAMTMHNTTEAIIAEGATFGDLLLRAKTAPVVYSRLLRLKD